MEKPHKKLKAWQKSVEFSVKIYEITENFPKSELYGLTNQLRRAAISVPSNIAEGAARNSIKEKAQFYNIARGSISEIDTQIEIASRLGFIDESDKHIMISNLTEIDKLLYGLWKKICEKS
ncbi:S23 ribosomal protein [Flexistipes sinusarabici DSM 4947]|uniref:S23 ribosomal protein n=1 Tax=Flexistipes sinusarabici (strain ATCC 49648 / DSM 4947 / MAS 10) TaxID=717231 RepID=F8E9X1_FLESM|nr:four helix bundle protein [Flexistipes sinusarabici]AEI15382.1 S23 ribosomal protein [Flexistipes sinusarabici DSM 4947]